MRYIINPEVFRIYPAFRRAVLIARGMDNSREHPDVLAFLRECEEAVRRDEVLAAPYEHPLLRPWAEAFSSMHLNPKRYPPSVINLIRRVAQGGRTAVRQYAGSAVQLREPAPSYPLRRRRSRRRCRRTLFSPLQPGKNAMCLWPSPMCWNTLPRVKSSIWIPEAGMYSAAPGAGKTAIAASSGSSTSRAAINLDMLTKKCGKGTSRRGGRTRRSTA